MELLKTREDLTPAPARWHEVSTEGIPRPDDVCAVFDDYTNRYYPSLAAIVKKADGEMLWINQQTKMRVDGFTVTHWFSIPENKI